jgi:uroporphyrin-III C-methyltransferase
VARNLEKAGARLLASADVVLHDRLAQPLLALASANAEVVDVGKAPGTAPVPQEQINRLLVEHGRRHRCVVRLKGGDPFVFARGAEEVDAIEAAGIDYEVVPGISSVLAGPTAAGVALTRRGVSRTVTVITGHDGPEGWPAGYAEGLVALQGTIVVLMGAAGMTRIARRLIEAGLAPGTPVVAIRGATTEKEEIRRVTLATVEEAVLRPPTPFVIGDVGAWVTTGGAVHRQDGGALGRVLHRHRRQRA